MDKIAVGAVVTTFYPDGRLNQLLEELVRQVLGVVVVDNTPREARVFDTRGLTHNNLEHIVEYLYMGENLGLAAALNRGVRHLQGLPLSHISFWNQDSIPPSGYISLALDEARSFRQWPNVIVCGNHVDPFEQLAECASVPAQRVVRLITSGMIVPAPLIKSIGPFRENFFVDAVDTDFSLRARAQGASLYMVRDLIIRHRFGDPARGRRPLPFSSKKTSGHPVWRQYWIARNEKVLIDEYRHLDTEAVRVIKKGRKRWFLRNLLAGPRRLELMTAIVSGMRDARNGKIRKCYDPRV